MENGARALSDVALTSLPMGTPLVLQSNAAQLYGLRDDIEVSTGQCEDRSWGLGSAAEIFPLLSFSLLLLSFSLVSLIHSGV